MTTPLRGLLITLIVRILLALSGPFMMHPEWMGANGGWRGGTYVGGGGGFTMLAFLAVLVVGVILLVRVLDPTSHQGASDGPRPETPLDSVRRRYAAGELTREQYEQMRRDLEGAD